MGTLAATRQYTQGRLCRQCFYLHAIGNEGEHWVYVGDALLAELPPVAATVLSSPRTPLAHPARPTSVANATIAGSDFKCCVFMCDSFRGVELLPRFAMTSARNRSCSDRSF